MTHESHVDDVLRGWMAEGAEHIPEQRLLAALEQLDSTRQLPASRWPTFLGDVRLERMAIVGTIAVLLAVAIGISIAERIGRTPSPSPVMPDAELHRYPAAGFQVELAEDWIVTSGSDPSTLAARLQGLRLFITSSDADGRLRTCDTPAGPWLAEACGPFDLDVAASPLRAIPSLRAPSEAIVLDGEPATLQRVTGYEYPARGAQAVARVLAMHDGRAFVIRVWSPGDRIDVIDDIIRSFSFVDAEEPGSRTTFQGTDATYEIRLPEAWSLDRGPDLTALYLTRGNIDISIRATDPDGQLLTCDRERGPWERCKASTATTLAELGRDVTMRSSGGSRGPYTRDAMLDGEPARVQDIVAQEHEARGAQWCAYVWAIHDDRAFVIRIWSPTSALDATVDDVLEGFAFLDG